MGDLSIEKIVKVAVELLEKQEGVKIDYVLEKKKDCNKEKATA